MMLLKGFSFIQKNPIVRGIGQIKQNNKWGLNLDLAAKIAT